MALCDGCGRLAVRGGGPGEELYRAVRAVAPGARTLCAACLDESWEGFERLRERHEEMVAAGAHPRVASRILVAEIEREEKR